jgi:chromosome segregation ATPase
MNRRHLILAAVIALCRLSDARAADTSTESRLRDALRAATSQLQALEDERGRLQANSAEQRKEIEDLKAKLVAASAAARPVIRTNVREVEELNRKLSEANEARDRINEASAHCQAALREASEATRAKEDERAQVAEKLGPLNDRVSTCEGKNAKMFQVATEILSRYEKMSVGEAIRAREPFLGLKRVELENLAQEYQDKLLDQRLPKQP